MVNVNKTCKLLKHHTQKEKEKEKREGGGLNFSY